MNYLGDTENPRPAADPLPDTRPYTLAAAFLGEKGYADVRWFSNAHGRDCPREIDVRRLRHFQDEFYEHRLFVYVKVPPEVLKADVTVYLNEQSAFDAQSNPRPLRVSGSTLNDVLVQLRAMCQVRAARMPVWLGEGDELPDPRNVVAFANGLLDLQAWSDDPDGEGRAVDGVEPPHWFRPPTDNWFSQTVLPRPYQPLATCPATEAFLTQSLGTRDQVELLQEWCGYVISPDTGWQKMLWMHGVGGSGKGTICRLMTDLVGKPNTATFKLGDLVKQFTLGSWIGKTLAIARDARLGKTSDGEQVIEELLAIVGEDDRFVDLKHKDPLANEKMGTRIVVAINGFPNLPANGNELRRRSMILSFGHVAANPDPHLYAKLTAELPGLTAWAMRGLRRLREREAFTVPARAEELLNRLGRLTSPVRSFVEECCVVSKAEAGDRPREVKRIMWNAWRAWARANGHKEGGINSFCERVYEGFPTVAAVRASVSAGEKEKRVQCMDGIELLPEVLEALPDDAKLMTREEADVRQGRA